MWSFLISHRLHSIYRLRQFLCDPFWPVTDYTVFIVSANFYVILSDQSQITPCLSSPPISMWYFLTSHRSHRVYRLHQFPCDIFWPITDYTVFIVSTNFHVIPSDQSQITQYLLSPPISMSYFLTSHRSHRVYRLRQFPCHIFWPITDHTVFIVSTNFHVIPCLLYTSPSPRDGV